MGLAIALVPPIPEPRAFRELVDDRTLFGVANFWNVVSNVPFLFVGVWGLYVIARGRPGAFVYPEEKWPYVVCFLAVALIAIGSTYYHLAPIEDRLMWDRLPIGLGFMALLSAVIAERIGVKAGLRALGPLLLAGVASVLYWRWSGQRGAENILPYALVQYGAIAAIVAIAALFPSRYTRGADVLIAVAIYAIAKLVEVLDSQIYALGHVVSGHTVKHLLAALAVWWLLRMLQLRAPLSRPS
ncbi:MAG TPA: ceramidase domain-containing protein [Burkholderiales bacterium]